MRQLTGLDTSFLNLETASTPLHVASAMILDGTTAPPGFGYDTIREVMAARVAAYAPFREKLVQVPFGIDLPWWVVDPDFDLEFHVRRSGVPPGGGERELAEVIARIHARPLDRSRPLWEMYVIEGLRDGHVAVMTKMHHAAIDGVSGAELAGALLDLTPDPRARPVPEPLPAEREPGQLEMLARGAAGLARQPVRLARTAARTARALPVVGRLAQVAVPQRVRRRIGDGDLIGQPRLAAPRTPFNGAITPHRRWAFDSLPLATVKAVKNAAGATVNDVVMAVCAGALRRYLVAHGGVPAEPLQAMIPISVRTEGERGAHGNKVTALLATLPTDLDDPRARLERIHEGMAVAKSSNAVPADLLQDYAQFATPAIAARAARVVARTRWADRLRSPINVVVSNVPGPRVPLYLAGARVRHYYPISAIADGVGLNITVISYEDRVEFGLVSCRELVPDLWDLMAHLRDELDALAEAVGA